MTTKNMKRANAIKCAYAEGLRDGESKAKADAGDAFWKLIEALKELEVL